MRGEIGVFISYLEYEKKAAKNTVLSYERDLRYLAGYLEGIGIKETAKVTQTSLNSCLLHLEREGRAASSISRMLASWKAFFHYEFREGLIGGDPAEFLKAPKVEKKLPTILTAEEAGRLLCQPKGGSAKEVRDRAMLELLYATGIRVSELVGLRLGDLNQAVGYIKCRDGGRERMMPFGRQAGLALGDYLAFAREELLKGRFCDHLFVNCSGGPMSRQGFWKIIKYYGGKAGIQADITPHTLRHSFAAHRLYKGEDIHTVQTALGHTGMTVMQMYQTYGDEKAGMPGIAPAVPQGRQEGK